MASFGMLYPKRRSFTHDAIATSRFGTWLLPHNYVRSLIVYIYPQLSDAAKDAPPSATFASHYMYASDAPRGNRLL